MKSLFGSLACLVLCLTFAVAASAQTAPLKIVVINTLEFDGKDGIVKYTNAMTALENEFKPLDAELKTMATKYENLAKELKAIQDQIAAKTVPVNEQAANAKFEEYQNLEVQMKRKQEEGKERFQRRQPQLLGPIQQDIGKAMQEFAQAKGYDLILDASALDQQKILLAYLPNKVDVTKEFITFYNARPASAATASTPR
ncbi:MAG: OmpH family outer membrane protein [Blastocatellia bacterium]|jgi:Skp family chaperone for outer membrane proteins|nr:OmpH family outer membrane protein [Blastocatellia bacterium]